MKRLLFVVLAACGAHHAAPTQPSTVVRGEIDLAESAELERRHDVAREHYERAVASAHDPASIAFARHKYAETLVTWGEVPEAKAQLEAAVAAMPDDASSWHDLGHVRHDQGDDAGAFAALGKARTLAPNDVRPRLSIAILHWKLGERAAALAEYKALQELDLPEPLRGKVKWAIGELSKPTP